MPAASSSTRMRSRSRRRRGICSSASASCSPSRRASAAGRRRSVRPPARSAACPAGADQDPVRGHAGQDQPQESAGRGAALLPVTLGRPGPLHKRRPPGHLQQRRRAG
jgi:hypothetical protein